MLRRMVPAFLLVLLLPICGCTNKYAQAVGERNYTATPLLDQDLDDIPELCHNPYVYRVGNSNVTGDYDQGGCLAKPTKYSNYTALAWALKNRSDAICDKYKVDLALAQTGGNFLADAFSAIIAPVGSIVGGVTGQAVSAAQGASTALKNTISGDIYQKITGVASNYIDAGRNEQWTLIEKRLRPSSYSNNEQLFNDIQTYHDKCSLETALQTAETQSSQQAASSAQSAAANRPGAPSSANTPETPAAGGTPTSNNGQAGVQPRHHR